jgi:8-oxo-dGTP diphosphatase
MPFTYDYPRPMVTVDAVVFRIYDNKTEVLLIKRGHFPFQGMWALPGGFVDMHETLEEAVERELEEETGLKNVPLEQLHAYSEIHRDPRGRNISITFYGSTDIHNSNVTGGDDAADAGWFPVDQLPELAFDHEKVIELALKRFLNGI